MPKRFSPEFLTAAAKMYESGMTFAQVATEFGRDSETLRVALLRHGVVARPKGGKPAKNRIEPPEGVIDAYTSGESISALAGRLGVSRPVVTRWIADAGVQRRGLKEAGKVRTRLTTPELRRLQTNENRRRYRTRKKGTPPPEDAKHGSPHVIANYGCCCGVCATAKREYDRTRRAANAVEISEKKRRYRLDNYEAVRDAQRRHYEQNTERVKAKVKKYAKTERGRDVRRAVWMRRRGVAFTPEGREYAALIVNDPCSYCGGAGGTVDHIVAVAIGGDGDWSNLTGACRSCNSRKRTEPLLRFMLRLQA